MFSSNKITLFQYKELNRNCTGNIVPKLNVSNNSSTIIMTWIMKKVITMCFAFDIIDIRIDKFHLLCQRAMVKIFDFDIP